MKAGDIGMKAFALGFALATSVCIGLAQDTISLARNFKAGEVDKYRSKMTVTVNGADVETTIEYSEKVKKVNIDGSAEVEVTTTSVEIKILGVVVDTPKLPAFLQKYSKSGVPQGMPAGTQGQARMLDYSRIIGPMMDKVLSVGKEYAVEWVDPKDDRNKISGKVRLESVVKGLAKIIGNYSSWNDKTTKDPVKISLSLLMDVASSKPTKFEGTIINPTNSGDPTGIEQGKFIVERLTK